MTADTTMIHPVAAVDLPGVVSLLEGSGLPLQGLGRTELWTARGPDGEPVAVGGLEVHGDVGLLRSLAVHPDERGSGRGRLLAEHVVAQARARQLRAVYALTTTADDFLQACGFSVVDRSAAPDQLEASAELSACPSSARLLLLELAGGAT